MNAEGKKGGLKGLELAKKIYLEKTSLAQERFMTPTAKFKRNELRDHYKDIIDQLYGAANPASKVWKNENFRKKLSWIRYWYVFAKKNVSFKFYLLFLGMKLAPPCELKSHFCIVWVYIYESFIVNKIDMF